MTLARRVGVLCPWLRRHLFFSPVTASTMQPACVDSDEEEGEEGIDELF